MSPQEFRTLLSDLPLYIVLIPFVIPRAIAELAQAQQKRAEKRAASEARLVDYRAKEFHDVTLGKDEAAHGFVYFYPTRALGDGTLVVRFRDAEEEGRLLEVRLPLERRADEQAAGQEETVRGPDGTPEIVQEPSEPPP